MTRSTPRTLNRKQAGFSLIDVLLALGVVILISGITLTGIRRTNESNQAKAVGEQMKMVGAALNTYVSLRYDTMVAHIPGTDDVGDPGTAADPGPRTCVWMNSPSNTLKMCTITSETLRRNGLLPNSFSGYNAFGSTYQYRIRIDTAGVSPLVDGMVWTDEAYTMEGEERYDLLGQAMLVAGADSGMTRSVPDKVEGFNGAWSEQDMGVSKLGVLAYRIGYNTFGYAAYLRLNGGEMLGDIDMGDNQIYGLSALKATNVAAETVRLKQDRHSIVFSNITAFDTADASVINTEAASDLSIGTQDDGTGKQQLVLRTDGPVRLLDVDNSTPGDLTMGNLSAQNATLGGNLGITGNTTATGNISAQGTITSANMIRGNSVVAGAGGATGNTVMFGGADGGIYFNTNTAGAVSSGIQLTSATNTITLTNNANLYTGGDIRSAGNITADDKLIVGNNGIVFNAMITPTQGTVGAGATLCNAAAIGVVARSASGDLVQCVQEGYWRTMGMTASSLVSKPGANACTGNGAPGTPVVITCSSGQTVITGGYQWLGGAGNAPRAAPISNYRSSINQWTVQAGATQAYSDTGAYADVPSCFATYAVCSK